MSPLAGTAAFRGSHAGVPESHPSASVVQRGGAGRCPALQQRILVDKLPGRAALSPEPRSDTALRRRQ